MNVITKNKADNLLRLPEKVKACNMQPGSLGDEAVDVKLWMLALWILISGAFLNVICTGPAHAGGLYIYEMGNPSDTGYAGAGLAGRAGDAGMGDVMTLNAVAAEIKTHSDACIPLGKQIVQLAEDFDLDGIQKLADDLDAC